jgi:hypothetical protein
MADINIAELIKSVQEDVTTIVRGEIELVKAELVPQAKSAGVGAGLFGAAGYLALTGSILLFIGGSFGLSALYASIGFTTYVALLLGFISAAVILFILAGLLALIGKSRMKFSGPDKTISSVEQSVGAVRSAVTTTRTAIEAKPLLPPKE